MKEVSNGHTVIQTESSTLTNTDITEINITVTKPGIGVGGDPGLIVQSKSVTDTANQQQEEKLQNSHWYTQRQRNT